MNYYEILEVSQNASPEVIKAAYKSLMQRYHPDRNPDNTEIAERASQITQAYEIISDASRRSAYDVELNLRESTINPGRSAVELASNKLRNKQKPSGKTSNRAIWIIILSIIVSGWLILSLSKRKKSQQVDVLSVQALVKEKSVLIGVDDDKSVQKDMVNAVDKDTLKADVGKTRTDSASKVINGLISDFTVNIDSVNNLPHVLFIPVLNARVGAFESDKVIRYVEGNKQLIVSRISEKLAKAKYEEFIKLDGEQFLKNLILDSIDETAGTDRFKEFPPSGEENPGRYGVVDIILPNSFSVR